MLAGGDATPSLQSVVDSHGHLTSTAEELEAVMVDHFQSVFRLPPPDLHPLHPPPPAMLFDKHSVDAGWYDGLMSDVTEAELVTTASLSPLVSSPGQDEVSIGLWKIALQGCALLRTLVAQLFTSCMRTSSFPSAWKTSVIVPLLKDATKKTAP